jgi:hypothetical protein
MEEVPGVPVLTGAGAAIPLAASRRVNAEDLRFAEDLHTYTTVKSPQSGKSPHYLAGRAS